MAKEDRYKNLKMPKKGEVRNPKGKPKGTISFKTRLKKYLETGTIIDGKKVSNYDMMILRLIEAARKGNYSDATRAIREILDRLIGKSTESVKLNHQGNLNIVFNVRKSDKRN